MKTTTHHLPVCPAILLLWLLVALVVLSGCSMGQITVRASLPMIEGGVEAMNRETDLALAEAAIPANIKLLEGMLVSDPDNLTLHIYTAQAYYGYAYGFVEDQDRGRASRFYQRGLHHGLAALAALGIGQSDTLQLEAFQQRLAGLQKSDASLSALFWTASCWAKWIDMNRDNPVGFAQLPKAVAMMEKVLEWDEGYYHGGPHLFFGVYYGSRAPMLGGDFQRSAAHFDQARSLTRGRLLIADLLQAQFLARQQFDREDFHQRLTRILKADKMIFPEMALANVIAQQKAARLLKREAEWF